jgi:PAS domain S-box-containing protein
MSCESLPFKQGEFGMSQKPDWIERRQSTRRKAEQLLAGVSSAEIAVQPTEVLVHELLVHKVELEMQVEELRRAHVSMEEARDRYVDLYDFAPVGYITVSQDGLISEINLTGAAMLGVERKQLLNSRFSKFISPPDTDRFHRLFMGLMKQASNATHAFALEIRRADGATFAAYLDCCRRDGPDMPATMRITVVDIGKIRQAEADARDTISPSNDRT